MILRPFDRRIFQQRLARRWWGGRERGAALMITMIFFVAISITIVLGATTAVSRELRTYQTIAESKFAYFAAESGVEDVVYRLRNDKQLDSLVEISLNGATSTVVITTVNATHRIVTATGTAATRYRQIDLDILKPSAGNFSYAAQIGGGGITHSGSGTITGDVSVNGPVTSSGSGSFDGDVTVTAPSPLDNITPQTTYDADEVAGDSDLSPKIDLAQSFIAPVSGKFTKVSLYMKRNATWSGTGQNATIRVTTDSGGSPATSALASGPGMNGNFAATTYAWTDIVFPSPATLVSGQTYWVVFDAASHATRNWSWGRSSADTYWGGSAKYKSSWSTGGSWSNITGDMDFKVTLTSGSSTITGAFITGTARADLIVSATIQGDAYYQDISGSTVSGTSYPGSPTQSPIPMPISSSTIAQWKTDAELGGIFTGNYSHSSSDGVSFGRKKIIGNLSLSGSGDFNITGTLYVEGNISHSGGGAFQCDPAYCSSSCIVIADSYIARSGSGIIQGSGTAGSYILLLSTTENCFGAGSPGPCAGSPAEDAISASGSGESVVFYSTDGQINLSGSGTMRAIAGYRLVYSGSGSVVYDPDLLFASFAPTATSSAEGVWTINTWRERR